MATPPKNSLNRSGKQDKDNKILHIYFDCDFIFALETPSELLFNCLKNKPLTIKELVKQSRTNHNLVGATLREMVKETGMAVYAPTDEGSEQRFSVPDYFSPPFTEEFFKNLEEGGL